MTQFPTGLLVELPVTDPAYANIENGAETIQNVQQANLTCVEGSSVPFNYANISSFDCPDEHGNQLYNLSCSGNETYFDDLTCNSVFVTVASCVFWDVKNGVWSSEGCMLNEQVNGSLSCQCTHLTDYVAQFSTIGKNFVSTVSFITEITLEDVLAALPAIVLFGSLCGIFAYAMLRSYGTYRKAEQTRILEELNDPATAVLFQLALQEENIARYMLHASTKVDEKLVKALVTHDEIFMALCLDSNPCDERKVEQVRELFHVLDDSGDGKLSMTELYTFIRFMNPTQR